MVFVATAAAFILDVAWLVSSGIIVWIVVSGGGQFPLAGHIVRVRSVSNPLIVWSAIAILRLLVFRRVPFLTRRQWPIDCLESRCESWCRRVSDALTHLTPAGARRAMLTLVIVVTVVKLANAAFYPGFFSGDDVEIHEMTFATLFGWDWSAWNLRSAFYPMTFIYPIQALLTTLGITDTESLVFAGRAVVAVLSSLTLWLVYRVGTDLSSPGVGATAAIMLGLHRLHVTFGGSELPRPIASLFIVAAFLCLIPQRVSLVRAAIAGMLLAIGGALRFGELVFVVPAIVTLLASGSRAAAAVLVMAFVVVASTVLGLADFWYWGSPFYSLHNIVQYTLVDRLSSRGYESFLYYGMLLTAWTSVPIALLAILGARSSWQVTVWWVIPLIALSFLPHKEPRYVIALLPFVCLGAALGLRRFLSARDAHALPWRSSTVAALTVVLCVGGVLLEVGGWRFRKPHAGLDLARFVREHGCERGVAVEQLWAVGGRLYLRTCGPVIDVGGPRPPHTTDLMRAIGSSEWILLRQPVRADERAMLQSAGVQEVSGAPDASYVVMRRE